MSVSSPCVRQCRLDEHGLCRGCGRSLSEIAGWAGLAEAERLNIMAGLPARLAASVPVQDGHAEATGAAAP